MPATKSIYLAGPITGLPYGEARHGWREEFAKIMSIQSPHIECFSPMRAKEFLNEQQSLQCKGSDLERLGHALSKPLGILTRDFNDVTNRDAMIACFLGATRVSIGTVWEMGVAYSNRKPVVVVMEPEGNVHDHAFVTHTAGYVVPTIEEAALILGSILTPGL
jgi:nucleoside 2-deoxyribosyltransferase